MSVAEFLAELLQRSISVWAEGDQLRYRAAKDTLTPALREELRLRKADILAFLRPSPMPPVNTPPPLLPLSREGVIPLSFAQERLWFLQQLEPESYAYVEPNAMRLGGQAQVKALEQSLNQVVQRHENLRTTFVSVQGTPCQVIDPHVAVPLPVIDLTALPDEERQTEAQRLFMQAGHLTFDLSRGPLLCFFLLRMATDDHILLTTLHHIISDRVSGSLFLHEMVTFYKAFSDGAAHQAPLSLPELPIHYADYALWQREWLQGETLERLLGYWRQHLAGAPPVLELPTDFPRPALRRYRGSHSTFRLPGKLSQDLRVLSVREGATLFMTLLAAFQVLLMRYSGQDEIVVGTSGTSRGRRELEPLIGLFINTLVLRTDLSGNPTFRQLLKRVREVCLGAYEHQELPFEKLVEALQPERNLSYPPLFQVTFTLEHAPVSSVELPGLTLEPMAWINNTAKFDIALTMTETGTSLIGNLQYNNDIFTSETITRLTYHLQSLLESIAAHSDQRLSDLILLSPAEQEQLLHTWNPPSHPPTEERCFPNLFEAQVAQTPDAVALVCEDQHLSYSELNQRANQLAHYLRELGVGPEVCVGLCMERSLVLMVGILGVLKAGGAYVPLDPGYPRDRLAVLVEDAHLALVLCQKHLRDRLPGEAARVLCIDDEWTLIGQRSQENVPGGATMDHVVYVIYTSGSTGKPKGVMVTHRGLSNYLLWCINTYQVDWGRGTPVHSATTFDLTVTSLFSPLLCGRAVILVPEEESEPFPLRKVLDEGGFSFLKLTPAHLELIAHWLPADRAAGMASRLIVGGEALTGEALAYWRAHAPETRVVNEYGPTETVVGCCMFEQAAGESSPGAFLIGRPIANMQIYVLDRNLCLVPIGVPGEMYIGGVGLARGYLDRPDLTAERFIPHPFANEPGARLYKTGDIARYRASGDLEYLGRNDHQIKIRGFRIEPDEIKAALARHPGVRESLVLAYEDGSGDKRLVAYLVPSIRQERSTSNSLRQHLQALLPEYMLPSAFVWLDEMPLTAHGKIDRHALPPPDWTRQITTSYAAPRTPTEERLASLWAQLLRCERVGLHDNFFELGGHSLLATRLLVRVSEAFQVSLPLRTLFETPTLAAFAARLDQQRVVDEEPEELPLVRGARYSILTQKSTESH